MEVFVFVLEVGVQEKGEKDVLVVIVLGMAPRRRQCGCWRTCRRGGRLLEMDRLL